MANGKVNAEDSDKRTWRVLPTAAYGLNGAYKVTKLVITPDPANSTFTIELAAAAKADSGIKASGEVTVRCLNNMTP